jgi:hypothetical protein
VRRVVGVAGGARKVDALLGVLRGALIDVLITDRFTAEKLVRRSGPLPLDVKRPGRRRSAAFAGKVDS